MKTYEEILQSILDRVPSNVDKREGSIIFDAVAPCAYFLAEQQFLIENFKDLVLPDTAEGEYLERLIFPYGLRRKSATKAIRELSTFSEVEIGTRWVLEDTTYIVTNAENGRYIVECEQFGEIGNRYKGTLTSLSGLDHVTATLGEILSAGTEVETDEKLRERLLEKMRKPATSGNVHHYEQWSMEVDGVGMVKVFPLHDGPGTVKILVVNSELQVDSLLPNKVKEHIENLKPIGATVTVDSPDVLKVHVDVKIQTTGKRSMDLIKMDFEMALIKHFKNMTFTGNSISVARVGNLLLEVEGISDYMDLQLNKGNANIELSLHQIPSIGTITFVEV